MAFPQECAVPAVEQERRALTVDEQCDIMSSHGIRFDFCRKENAKRFLRENTYFFKIKAFDNNFQRDENGVYRNLDFAYLQDLSTVDFELRLLILRMTGDIEHALRIRFNNLISRVNEDGYQVIREYEQDQREYHAKRAGQHAYHKDYQESVYTKGMIAKYLECKPVWLFWETCTLNALIRCYRSFLQHRRFRDVTYSLLYGVRLLRNAASHHNCLLIPPVEPVKPTSELNRLLEVFLPHETESRASTLRLAQNDPLIHDFSCVVIAYVNLVKSESMRKHVAEQIEVFIDRLQRHIDWYRNPESGCPHLVAQLEAIHLLLSGFLDFNRRRDDGTLLPEQERLLSRPDRKPVRHGKRRARNKTAPIPNPAD